MSDHEEIFTPTTLDKQGSENLADPQVLLSALQHLRKEIAQEGEELFQQWRPLIQRQDFLVSAQNLATYLALRRRDLRPLLAALMPWGLSSLGRSEARVLPNLDAVIATLAAITQYEIVNVTFNNNDRICVQSTGAVHDKRTNSKN